MSLARRVIAKTKAFDRARNPRPTVLRLAAWIGAQGQQRRDRGLDLVGMRPRPHGDTDSPRKRIEEMLIVADSGVQKRSPIGAAAADDAIDLGFDRRKFGREPIDSQRHSIAIAVEDLRVQRTRDGIVHPFKDRPPRIDRLSRLDGAESIGNSSVAAAPFAQSFIALSECGEASEAKSRSLAVQSPLRPVLALGTAIMRAP